MGSTDTSFEHYLGQTGFATTTRELYGYHLREYGAWCMANDVKVLEATASDVVRYLDGLRDAESTVSNKFYALKGYYNWLVSLRHIAESPMQILRTKRLTSGPPDSLSIEELRALLAAAGGDRNWSLIALISLNSLRVTELVECNVSDLERSHGVTTLRFKPQSKSNRPSFTVLAPEVAEVVARQLEGRRTGPLLLDSQGDRMSRRAASWLIAEAGKRAGISYKVTPRTLAYTLPTVALEKGFSFVGLIRAIGVPQPRHGSRWSEKITALPEQHAAVRLSRLVLQPPESSWNWLLHAEAVLNETDLPDAFAVMTAGAVLEQHLRLLCLENNIPVRDKSNKGSLNIYVEALRRENVIRLADKRIFENVGDLRNDAAHGWFEKIPPGEGVSTIRAVRELIAKYPLQNGRTVEGLVPQG